MSYLTWDWNIDLKSQNYTTETTDTDVTRKKLFYRNNKASPYLVLKQTGSMKLK